MNRVLNITWAPAGDSTVRDGSLRLVLVNFEGTSLPRYGMWNRRHQTWVEWGGGRTGEQLDPQPHAASVETIPTSFPNPGEVA